MAKYVDYNGVKYLWQKMLAKFAPLTRAIPSGGTTGQVLKKSSGTDYDVAWSAETDTDTKNTAGATDTSSKIYLIGATTQGANPQTYSDDNCYVTDGAFVALTINGISIGIVNGAPTFRAGLGTTYKLDTAATYSVGSVASGNTGLVTGGDVYTALQNISPSISGDLIYKGAVSAASALTGTALEQGWTYVASADFTINSNQIQTGDFIIINTSGTYSTESALWAAVDVIQTNMDRMTDTDIDNAIAEAEAA